MPWDPLSEEQRGIRELVRTLTRERIAPRAAEIDESGDFPWDMVELLREHEIFGLAFGERHGGANAGALMLLVAVEEISKADATVGLILAVQELSSLALRLAGTEEQQDRFLPKLASGEWIAAYALTEPGSGSDAAAMRTEAKREGDEYVLNGSKRFITNAGVAHLYTVFAKTDPSAGHDGISCFVVEADAPGFEVGRIEPKLGIKGSTTGEIFLSDCRIPAANRVGEEGEGFRIAMDRISVNRLLHCPTMIGLARQAYRMSVEYAHHRQQFGGPISRFQAIQHMLADMATALYACEKMVLATAETAQGGADIRTEASMCKVFVSERCFEVADKAVQIHGNVGVTRNHPVEFIFRRLRMWRIVTGTSEIQRNTIAKGILG